MFQLHMIRSEQFSTVDGGGQQALEESHFCVSELKNEADGY